MNPIEWYIFAVSIAVIISWFIYLLIVALKERERIKNHYGFNAKNEREKK